MLEGQKKSDSIIIGGTSSVSIILTNSIITTTTTIIITSSSSSSITTTTTIIIISGTSSINIIITNSITTTTNTTISISSINITSGSSMTTTITVIIIIIIISSSSSSSHRLTQWQKVKAGSPELSIDLLLSYRKARSQQASVILIVSTSSELGLQLSLCPQDLNHSLTLPDYTKRIYTFRFIVPGLLSDEFNFWFSCANELKTIPPTSITARLCFSLNLELTDLASKPQGSYHLYLSSGRGDREVLMLQFLLNIGKWGRDERLFSKKTPMSLQLTRRGQEVLYLPGFYCDKTPDLNKLMLPRLGAVPLTMPSLLSWFPSLLW
ncbi:hypothetical protein STEG23_038015 [Scotinomys teguina]